MSIQAIRFNGRYYIDHAPDPGSDAEDYRSDGGRYFAEVEAVLSIVPADPSKYRRESVSTPFALQPLTCHLFRVAQADESQVCRHRTGFRPVFVPHLRRPA
jgi:hypothetical protein